MQRKQKQSGLATYVFLQSAARKHRNPLRKAVPLPCTECKELRKIFTLPWIVPHNTAKLFVPSLSDGETQRDGIGGYINPQSDLGSRSNETSCTSGTRALCAPKRSMVKASCSDGLTVYFAFKCHTDTYRSWHQGAKFVFVFFNMPQERQN